MPSRHSLVFASIFMFFMCCNAALVDQPLDANGWNWFWNRTAMNNPGVHSMGPCGGSYAWAAALMTSYRHILHGGANHTLNYGIISPQTVFDCGNATGVFKIANSPCLGGYVYKAINLGQNSGITVCYNDCSIGCVPGRNVCRDGWDPENLVDCVPNPNTCPGTISCMPTPLTRYNSASYLVGTGTGQEAAITAELYNVGPITMVFDKCDNMDAFFANNASGIYSDTCINTTAGYQGTYTAVGLGYDYEPGTGNKFWVIQMHSGTTYGLGGVIRIRAGLGIAGIETYSRQRGVAAVEPPGRKRNGYVGRDVEQAPDEPSNIVVALDINAPWVISAFQAAILTQYPGANLTKYILQTANSLTADPGKRVFTYQFTGKRAVVQTLKVKLLRNSTQMVGSKAISTSKGMMH